MKGKPEPVPLPVPSIYGAPLTPAWYQPPDNTRQPDESAPYTIPEAADALGIGLTTAKKLIATRELRSFVIRRRRLVPRDAVVEFIARRAAGKRR